LLFFSRVILDRRPNLAAMNAANLAIRPAHVLQVVQALIFGLDLLANVYQLHGFSPVAQSCQKAVSVSGA